MYEAQTRLKELRETRGLTQFELSRLTGINRVTIARYETGNVGMSLKNATKIAAVLGCTVNDMVDRKEA